MTLTMARVLEHYTTSQHNRQVGISCDVYNAILMRWYPNCTSLKLEVGHEKLDYPPLESKLLAEIIADYHKNGWILAFSSQVNETRQYYSVTVTRKEV